MSWLSKIIVGGVLFVLPFLFNLNLEDQFRQPKEDFLIVLAYFIVASFYYKHISRISAWFIVYLALNQFFSNFRMQHDVALPLLAALMVGGWFSRFNQFEVEKGLRWVSYLALILGIWGAAQYLGLDPIVTYMPGSEMKPVCFFGQHTLYGPVAVAGYAIALFQRRFFMAALLSIPVMLVEASFTYLSFFVVNALFIHNESKRVFYPLMIAGCLAVIVFVTCFMQANKADRFMNDNGRYMVWYHTLYLSQGAPIIGRGLGSFKQFYYPILQEPELRRMNGLKDEHLNERSQKIAKEAELLKFRSGKFLHPHNELVLMVFETGIIGIIFTIMVFFAFLFAKAALPVTQVTNTLFAVFMAFMANSMGSFPLHLTPQGMYPLICFVLLASWAKPDRI